MMLLDFLRTLSSSQCKVDDIKEYVKNSNINLNKNYTYAMGATWILPLPLILAFKYKNLEVAKYLIERGASLDVYCKKYETTPRDIMPKKFKI